MSALALRLVSVVAPVAFALGATGSLEATASANSGIKLDKGEVFFDHQTGHFGARLQPGAGTETTIALIAKPKSQITLSYWQSDGTCPTRGQDPIPTLRSSGVRIESRAVIPIGNPVGDKQKFITKVGPFFVGRSYCFYVDVIELDSVGELEKERVEESIRAGLSDALEAGLAKDSPQITAEEIRRAIEQRLGWLDRTIVVPLPDYVELQTVSQALAALITRDSELASATQAALQALYDANRDKELTDGQVAEMSRFAQASHDLLPSTLTAASLARRIQKPDELAEIIAGAASRDRRGFLTLVHDNRLALKAAKRSRLPRAEERALRQFLDTDTLEYARCTIATISRFQETMKTSAQAERQAAVRALRREVFGSESVGAKELDAWSSVTCGVAKNSPATDEETLCWLATRLDQIAYLIAGESDESAAWKDLEESRGYKSFVQRMKAVERRGVGASAEPAEASFAKRFEFYVSAEVGVAPVWLSDTASIGSYFGLNFYFAAIDKDERLRIDDWSGRDFLRRFSLTAGVTLTNPKTDPDLRIDGALSNRWLLVGAGLRMTEYIRLSAGTMIFTQKSNPIDDQPDVRFAPYVGVSLDFDVLATVKKWFTEASNFP